MESRRPADHEKGRFVGGSREESFGVIGRVFGDAENEGALPGRRGRGEDLGSRRKQQGAKSDRIQTKQNYVNLEEIGGEKGERGLAEEAKETGPSGVKGIISV